VDQSLDSEASCGKEGGMRVQRIESSLVIFAECVKGCGLLLRRGPKPNELNELATCIENRIAEVTQITCDWIRSTRTRQQK